MVTWLRRRIDEADRITTGVAAALVASLVVVVIVGASMGTTWRAVAVLRDTVEPPSDIAERVTEDTVAIAPDLSARLYRPLDASGPLPAFVIIHGAIGQGPDDPRIVDLSRALAATGATVVAPVLESLAQFRLDVDDPGRVAATVEWLADQPELAADGKVGIFGISIGGSYGLLASVDDRAAEHVSSIMVFGGYHDLNPLLAQWLTDPVDTDTVLDPLREGRWLVLLGNIDKAVAENDIPEVSACLQSLLDDLDCHVSPDVGPRAQVLIDAALSEDALDPTVAARLLGSLTSEIESLSPSRLLEAPPAPVHLLHAVGDPVVPTTETQLLAATLTSLGADVSVHITDVFEHVDADSAPPLTESWPLVRFVAVFLDGAGL